MMSLLAIRALVNLNGPGHYLHWGFIQLSVANALLIALMVVVFVERFSFRSVEEEAQPMSIDTEQPGPNAKDRTRFEAVDGESPEGCGCGLSA